MNSSAATLTLENAFRNVCDTWSQNRVGGRPASLAASRILFPCSSVLFAGQRQSNVDERCGDGTHPVDRRTWTAPFSLWNRARLSASTAEYTWPICGRAFT